MKNRSDFFNSVDEKVSKSLKESDNNIKKVVGRTSLFLISYHFIMAAFTLLAITIETILHRPTFDVTNMQHMSGLGVYADALMLGLLVSTIFGVILFWYLEKGSDLMKVLQEKHGKMMPKHLIQLMAALMAVQIVFSVGTTAIEWFLNLFGISMLQSIEAASIGGYSLPIILYAGIIGPITEEIIFRGAILHYLQKYGKWFAMVMSSLLFGLFHANLPQGVFAFLIGMILAYVTYEYSIKWAMILHVFNNLILNILMTASGDFLNPVMVEQIQTAVFIIAFVYTCIIIWRHKAQIAEYITSLKQDNVSFREAFSSIALWVLIVILGFEALAMLTSI